MQYVISGNALALALQPEGLLPAECRDVSLQMPVDGALTIKYEVNVTEEDVPKLIRALHRVINAPIPHTVVCASCGTYPHETNCAMPTAPLLIDGVPYTTPTKS
jgi:hypothetical protein